jgi:hypothetical protein
MAGSSMYTNQFQPQFDSVAQQRDITQAILAQALAPQQNQNAFTGIARVIAAKLAKKDLGKLDAQQQDLANKQTEARRLELSRVLSQTKDRPAQTMQPGEMGPPAPAMKGIPMNEALMQSAIPEFQDMGLKQTLDAKAISNGDIGTYNPRDYTPGSWAKFITSRDPAELRRFAPQRNVDIGGVPHVFDPVEGFYVPGSMGTGAPALPPAPGGGLPNPQPQQPGKPITADDVAANRATIVQAETEAKAKGESAGNQDTKAPVLDSMNYVMTQYEELFPKLATGGPLGLMGKASGVFDSQDVMRFENLNEQLSTELRTIMRIPGEGTLSDQEQKQYGLQLPNIDYDEATNKAILKDLNARTRLRLGMPVEGVPAGSGIAAQNTNQQGGQQKTGGFKLLGVRAK